MSKLEPSPFINFGTNTKKGSSQIPYCFLFRMIIGVVVFQVLMIGVVGLKQSYAPSILLLPLPVITVLFYFFIMQHYIRPSANLSLKTAHGLEDPAPNFVQVSCVCTAIQSFGLFIQCSQNDPEEGSAQDVPRPTLRGSARFVEFHVHTLCQYRNLGFREEDVQVSILSLVLAYS